MTAKPIVYLSRVIPESGMKLLYENCDVKVNTRDSSTSREELLTETRDCEGVLVLLTERIDEEFLDNAKRLKIVSSYSVGLDHVDVAACTRHGVMVTNTPDVLTDATADLAFALILSAARRVTEGDRYIRKGEWNAPFSPYLLVGQDIVGATIGIIGFGRIGQAVAKRASGFGMKVVYYDRNGAAKMNALVPSDSYLANATSLRLEELLRISDIVSVHLPLTGETKRLIGTREFSMMKKTAVFVNTSRGGLIDQDALVEALRSKKIFTAGLDVFEKEPLQCDSPLIQMENLVMTPHLGSASLGARAGMAELAARNLIDGLNGKVPKALANIELLDIRRIQQESR